MKLYCIFICILVLSLMTGCRSTPGGEEPNYDYWKEIIDIFRDTPLPDDDKEEDPVSPPEDVDPDTPPTAGDLPGGIEWANANISGWPATAKLTVSFSGQTLNMRYDKANVWPAGNTRASDGGPLVGNAWVIAKSPVTGRLTAATWEWMRPGQQAKPAYKVEDGHTKVRQFPSGWQPVAGEEVWIMVSSMVRGSERTVNERSNAVKVTWPNGIKVLSVLQVGPTQVIEPEE